MCRIPKGAVIAGGKFRAVRHDGDMQKTRFIQSMTNCRHAPVHHIRRGDDIRAAMPMRGIFAKANIRNHKQRGILLFDMANGSLGDAVRSIRLRADRILFLGNPENQHA